MTCIVGLAHQGKVWMGGDSAGVAGLDLAVRKDPKVFRRGPFLIGYTSSFRMGQLLRFKFNPPEIPDGMDLFEYLATLFVDALRTCLKDGGYARKVSEEETGGTFLVGIHGRLFAIGNDYQVAENAAPFAACGCGDSVALGALEVMPEGMLPAAKLRRALEAAEAWSAGVRGPFVIDSV